MLESMHIVDKQAAPRATVDDFCEIFTQEMHSLYLLSLLLTADNEKAERCFVGAMGECVERVDVFIEWAHLWARRTILKQAIQMMMPAPERVAIWSFMDVKRPATSSKDKFFAEVLALGAFERFVFVMSVLEEQSDEDCATLLRCSRRDVMIGRTVALKRLASSDVGYPQAELALQA